MSDRMDFWWDAQQRKYVEGTRTGPIHRVQETKMAEYDGTETRKKTLDDTGTRFGHLADFQDYLSDGLVVVTNSLERYANDTDKERKKSLESSLTLLKNYLNTLAQYEQQKWKFNALLDANVPTRMVLDAIKSDKIALAAIEKAKAIGISQKGNGQTLLGQGGLADTDGAPVGS
jgi:hypothetical protein